MRNDLFLDDRGRHRPGRVEIDDRNMRRDLRRGMIGIADDGDVVVNDAPVLHRLHLRRGYINDDVAALELGMHHRQPRGASRQFLPARLGRHVDRLQGVAVDISGFAQAHALLEMLDGGGEPAVPTRARGVGGRQISLQRQMSAQPEHRLAARAWMQRRKVGRPTAFLDDMGVALLSPACGVERLRRKRRVRTGRQRRLERRRRRPAALRLRRDIDGDGRRRLGASARGGCGGGGRGRHRRRRGGDGWGRRGRRRGGGLGRLRARRGGGLWRFRSRDGRHGRGQRRARNNGRRRGRLRRLVGQRRPQPQRGHGDAGQQMPRHSHTVPAHSLEAARRFLTIRALLNPDEGEFAAIARFNHGAVLRERNRSALVHRPRPNAPDTRPEGRDPRKGGFRCEL